MSDDAPVTVPAKNANRLNRVFRQPQAMVQPRAWRENEDDVASVGVTAAFVDELLASLTPEEAEAAAAGKSIKQVAMDSRAARFGTETKQSAKPKVQPLADIALDSDVAAQREARWGVVSAAGSTVTTIPADVAAQREARFASA